VNRLLEAGLKSEGVDTPKLILMLPYIMDEPPAWLAHASMGTYAPTPEDLTILLESVNAAHIGELMEVAPDGDVLLTKVVKPGSPEVDSAVPIDIGSVKQSYENPMVYAIVGTRMSVTDLRAGRPVRSLPVSIQYEVLRTALAENVFAYSKVKLDCEILVAYILGALNTQGIHMPVKYLKRVSGDLWDPAWKRVRECVAKKRTQLAHWEEVSSEMVPSGKQREETTRTLDRQGDWSTQYQRGRDSQLVELKRFGLRGPDYRDGLQSVSALLDDRAVSLGAKTWLLRQLLPCCESKTDVLRMIDVCRWAIRENRGEAYLGVKKRIALIDLYYL